ncbi:MAG: elongation factor G-like protein EF-G2 [Kineosporiaceae bacterium]
MASTGRARTGSGQGPTDPLLLRNVVVVGHAGSGKTTLVEAALVAAGALPRAGRVEDGTTVCDHEEIERKVHRSVGLSVASLTVGDVRVNLVDTPGHPDFVGEVRAGLRAADAALFTVSAVDGVDGATRMLWEECAAVGMPRAVVVTHVDQQRGDFDESEAICRRVFGDGVHALWLPLLADDEQPAGLLDLLTLAVRDRSSGRLDVRDADPEHRELVSDRRGALIEAIIQESEDDTLLERWLAGEDVEEATLVRDLERAMARGAFHPVVPVVATTGLGVPELLDLLVAGFPSPAEHPLPGVGDPDGAPAEPLECDPSGPLVAEVVKTTSDPYVGRISIVRVFSGTLQPDVPVHVSGHFARFAGVDAGHPDHDVDERVGSVARVLGAQLHPVTAAAAGDLVAVARLSHAETGDTLSDPSAPLLMEPWLMPEPLLPTAIAARSSAEEDKLAQGLARLVAEDPTVRVEITPDTHQLVLWTMGEAHREVLLDRLRSRHGVDVEQQAVRVSLRETLSAPGSGHGRHVKQSGGHGQFAVCDLELTPLPQGSGVEFVDRVVGGVVPRHFVPSVEKGARAQLERGVAAGYPLTDVRITLVGGKAHSVDSSDAAFQTAAALAVKEAATAAGVTLLEPLDEVAIEVDDEYVGTVMSDLSGRRGKVLGTAAAAAGRTSITAEVPALELTRYAIDLRSLAHGTGTFNRHYARHSPMPAAQARPLLAGTS